MCVCVCMYVCLCDVCVCVCVCACTYVCVMCVCECVWACVHVSVNANVDTVHVLLDSYVHMQIEQNIRPAHAEDTARHINTLPLLVWQMDQTPCRTQTSSPSPAWLDRRQCPHPRRTPHARQCRQGDSGKTPVCSPSTQVTTEKLMKWTHSNSDINTHHTDANMYIHTQAHYAWIAGTHTYMYTTSAQAHANTCMLATHKLCTSTQGCTNTRVHT